MLGRCERLGEKKTPGGSGLPDWEWVVNGLFENSPFLIFVNKVLLEFSHTYSFTYWLWLFLHHNGRVRELWQRPVGPQGQKIDWHFTEKWQNLALQNVDFVVIIRGVDIGANSFSLLICRICGACRTFQWGCSAGSYRYKPGPLAWNCGWTYGLTGL